MSGLEFCLFGLGSLLFAVTFGVIVSSIKDNFFQIVVGEVLQAPYGMLNA